MSGDDATIGRVLDREGGRNDRIRSIDAGGATNRGVTLQTYSEFLGRAATEDELWALTEEQTHQIYDWYIHRLGIDAITDPDVRALMIDIGVLHGPTGARRMLQRALGVDDDGVIGQKTLAALFPLTSLQLQLKLLGERAAWFGRKISGDLTDRDKDGIPDATELAKGWLNRAVADPLHELARRVA